MTTPLAPKSGIEELSRYVSTVAAGELIFREGDLTSDLFIIEQGRVELTRDHGGVPRIVATLGPGELFGELALLEDQPRDHSARAATDCQLLKLDFATLMDLIRENPQIALHAMRRLSRRLRDQERAALDAPPVIARGPLVSPRLVHVATGTEFPFAEVEAVVGRGDRTTGWAPEIDLAAVDSQRTTSRRHAVMFLRGEAAVVREEPGVSNGTFVNGRRVASGVEMALRDGDRVRFGLVELVLRGGA